MNYEELKKRKIIANKILEKYNIKVVGDDEYTKVFWKNLEGSLYAVESINEFCAKCILPYPIEIKKLLARIVILIQWYTSPISELDVLLGTDVIKISPSDDELNIIIQTVFANEYSRLGYKQLLLWDTSILDFYGYKIDKTVEISNNTKMEKERK